MDEKKAVEFADADDRRFRIRPYQQVASSVVGALCTSLMMTPMDVVKTRIQVQQKLVLSNKCYLYCNGLMDHLCPCGPNGSLIPDKYRFNGTLDAFLKISRNEGVASLWSGLSPTLVLALPTTVLYFVSYEQIRLKLRDLHMERLGIDSAENYKMPMIIPLVAGCSARILAVTVVNPLELIRTKMQSEKMSYREVGTAFKKMFSQHGTRGLFRGLFPTILRDTPFSSVYWASYETYKKFLHISQPNLPQSFIGGGLAGGLAAAITCPFDVVKTHQQIEFGEKFIYSANGKKSLTGTFETAKNIYRTGGFSGFFSGLVPRLVKVVTACAVMISTYEFGKKFFYDYNVLMYNENLLKEISAKANLSNRSTPTIEITTKTESI